MPTKGPVSPPPPEAESETRSAASQPGPRREGGASALERGGPAPALPGRRAGPGKPVGPGACAPGSVGGEGVDAALAGTPSLRRRGKGQRLHRGNARGGGWIRRAGDRRGTGGQAPLGGGQGPGAERGGAGLTVIRGMLFLPWKDILLLGRPVRPS